MPGVERRDLCGEELRPQEVLQAAINSGIYDVVIIGRHRDGSRYVASSGNNIDQVVGALMAAVNTLSASDVINFRDDEDIPHGV